MRATDTAKSAAETISNRIVSGLPFVERSDIQRRCKPVELVFGDIVTEAGQEIRHVYFPTTAFISTTATINGHTSLEVALIGNEGVFGVPLALGVNMSSLRAIVQGPGLAMRMTADEFRTVLNVSPALRRTLHAYAHVMLAQIAQVAVCTCYHVVEERLARWLLMTHDRAHSDTFNITHELLAEMLGVRRAGVSIAAGALQARDLISYSRGRITVTNRKGLEKASCECYASARRIYDKVLG